MASLAQSVLAVSAGFQDHARTIYTVVVTLVASSGRPALDGGDRAFRPRQVIPTKSTERPMNEEQFIDSIVRAAYGDEADIVVEPNPTERD